MSRTLLLIDLMTTEDNVKALILSDAVKSITELKSESDFRIGPRMRAKYTLFAIQILGGFICNIRVLAFARWNFLLF